MRSAAVVLLVSMLYGCAMAQSNGDERANGKTESAAVNGTFSFEGRIVFNDLEGGFYGIVTDSGKRYDPQNLPADMRQEGLKVKGRARLLKDMMSFHMWGTLIEIVTIEPM
jgi:hypothetical protein